MKPFLLRQDSDSLTVQTHLKRQFMLILVSCCLNHTIEGRAVCLCNFNTVHISTTMTTKLTDIILLLHIVIFVIDITHLQIVIFVIDITHLQIVIFVIDITHLQIVIFVIDITHLQIVIFVIDITHLTYVFM